MKTIHNIIFNDSREMEGIDSESVDLVVTSPPYPMIEMWDALFSSFSDKIGKALKKNEGALAFELMHRQLDLVWDELARVVKPSGFVCINIGDATRKIGEEFQLYSNHARITGKMVELGFSPLPVILWRKGTTSPNKFMGSGMLPAGAYVTLEHEYILIFRKGGKRQFQSGAQKDNRNESAFFWEERNHWFSDTWTDVAGARQKTGKKNLRDRNAAFPFELAHRLICMYSVKGDTVLDPFLGTGTTTAAAMINARNSIGIEYDPNFDDLIRKMLQECPVLNAKTISDRLETHRQFVKSRLADGKPLKHHNDFYDFPVMTRQETGIKFHTITGIHFDNLNCMDVTYCLTRGMSEPLVIPKSQKKENAQMSLFGD